MNKKKLFIIMGRSAVGKSSLVKEVCKRLELVPVQSYTTRFPRPNEKKVTADHIFITEDEVKLYQNDIATYTEINGFLYFTTYKILNQCDIYVIDPIGLERLKSNVGDKYELVEIYIRVPKSIAEKRAEKRGDENFKTRRAVEDTQFSAYEKAMQWHYHVLNDGTFEEGVQKLERIIKKELTKEGK